ncbi:MAG TPA: efflux RND transporter periplasmic adaptor subunit [Opitutaceae bacterium]|nr:efflux RND transporter periplasmic adaptor subunit [Opitutaceae bacterium]
MLKKLLLTIFGLVVLVGVLAGLKFSQFSLLGQSPQVYPATVVTTAKVGELSYSPSIRTIGSVVAAQGVTVSTEVSGTIRRIAFESGAAVNAGDLLVELDVSSEEAQLRSAEASADLAHLSLTRSRELRATDTTSQADLDAAIAQAKQADAQVANIQAIIAKKTIRAPFAGRVGIREVNLGQYLNAGSPIVSLQSVDPVFVDFSLPQQHLSRIAVGMTTRATSDAFAGATFEGTLSAINTEIDTATRNLRLRATFSNTDGRLRPGMFVSATLVESSTENVLTIPGSSVLYAPYGDSVFIVEEQKDEATGATVKQLRQAFVRLGAPHGDFVAVISGVEVGDEVVSTGVFKLRNKMPVEVDNKLAPAFQLDPNPENS